MDIYAVKVDWDEDGCKVSFIHDDPQFSITDMRVDAEQCYDAIKAGILPWLMERDMHRASYMREAQESPDFAEGWVEMLGDRAVATREDGSLRMEPDEEPDDWRERLADNADWSRKVAKGE